MQQPALPGLANAMEDVEDLVRDQFSHGETCPEQARLALEDRYEYLLEETDQFDRQLVSFQANKTETLHSWIKYREGFSAELVDILLDRFGVAPGDAILDPFAGSCTTLLCAQMRGIDAVGIELLPHSHLAWEAKSSAFAYDLPELRAIRDRVRQERPPATDSRFRHLRITRTAFPAKTEADLMAYTAWFARMPISPQARTLCRLLLLSILEDISYTRKDGQYLRWDGRAGKIVERNEARLAKGRRPIKGIDKGRLPEVRDALLLAFDKVIVDVAVLQREPPPASRQRLIKGNTLYELPALSAGSFSAVITSPPYANRYDYTRTYALELAYLGIGDEIFDLRQEQLSCTVENRPKLDKLRAHYEALGQVKRFRDILHVIESNAALHEINHALQTRNELGEINNRGVLRMIDQYFAELTFVFAELHRVVKSEGRVAFVNDNVRYAGEVIPVDLLTTDLAASLGFLPEKVYVLPQRKGNSSQQMGRYGRAALRKSITVWKRP